ncbi:hypothetical protein [Zhihengliuella sp.]|uniref:hypothetical protein n=1 Tax=Zhihengliuella sp. TaxID=1954483 RepID=UPI0028128A9C|nr:hypothetical protein [Zhihengliuella sp.]
MRDEGPEILVVGCTGLSRQVQFVDTMNGQQLAAVDQVTSAQRGVQEMAALPSGELVIVSAGGVYSLTPGGTVTPWPRTEAAFQDAYDPRCDDDGIVWAGVYGPTGGGRFLRADPRERTVALMPLMPLIASDTDYVSCVSVTREKVWGGTGSSRPRLVVLDKATKQSQRTIPLPDAAASGNVQWIEAWDDIVVAGYRGLDGRTRTAIYDIRKETFEAIDPPALSAFAGRVRNRLFYFDSHGLCARDLPSGKTVRLLDMENLRQWPLYAEIENPGSNFPWLRYVARSRENSEYLVGRVLLDSPSFRYWCSLEIEESAQKVHSLNAGASGQVYAGGYQASSLAVLGPGLERIASIRGEGHFEQVESMVEVDDRLVVASYPACQIATIDLETLRVEPFGSLQQQYAQSRPFGLAVSGSQAFVGSVPSQGKSGGSLLRLDLRTKTVLNDWGEVAGDHSIVGLTMAESGVVITTSKRGAYGAPDSRSSASVLLFDPARGRNHWQTVLEGEGEINSPIVVGRELYVAVADGIVILDIGTGRVRGRIDLFGTRTSRGYRTNRLAYHGSRDTLVHGSGGQITAIKRDRSVKAILARGHFEYPVVGPTGRIYAIRAGRFVTELALPDIWP